jgi:hypothetical protein
MSAARQRLDQIDNGVLIDRIAQRVSVAHLPAIDENRHVLAQRTLIVEHVPTRPRIVREISLEDVPQRIAGHFARRTLHVPLNTFGKSHGRHAAHYSEYSPIE